MFFAETFLFYVINMNDEFIRILINHFFSEFHCIDVLYQIK